MKLSLNGALTIGTLDGANVEMREEVGAENFFLFGLTAEQVRQKKAQGYRAKEIYERDPELKEALDLLASGYFSHGDRATFAPLFDSLVNWDEYLVLADYRDYIHTQELASKAYGETERWTRMSILNVARMGKFSSDRSIAEYAGRIWHAEPVQITAPAASPTNGANDTRRA